MLSRLKSITVILIGLTGAAVLLARTDPRYRVAGIVVDSSSQLPIANMLVSLTTTMAQGQRLEQVTQQDGRFSFVVDKAGKYRLEISKPGYPLQLYLQAEFAPLVGAVVVRDGLDTHHLVLQARRGGAISGQIQDDGSEPVPDASVAVLESTIINGEPKVVLRRQLRANANGEFRFANLRPGNYYVCAMGRPWFADQVTMQEQVQMIVNQVRKQIHSEVDTARRRGPAPMFSPELNLDGAALTTTCYPDAQTFSGASLVHVDAGGESQLTIMLERVKGFSVKVKLHVSGPMSDIAVRLVKEFGGEDMLFATGYRVSREGVFEFNNIPADSYQVVASSYSGPGVSNWDIRKVVKVGASDTEVTLKAPPEGSISGRLLFKGGRPKSMTGLFVSFRNQYGNVFQAHVSPEGNFVVRGLTTGKYDVTSNLAGYIPAYSVEPSGNPLPLPIEITSGASARRDLMLTEAGAEVRGVVEKAGIPQAGSFVLLMPREPARKWAFRVDQTNTDGSFRLTTIPAGDYFLIALSGGKDIAYCRTAVAAILAKAAMSIHVRKDNVFDRRLNLTETVSLHLPPT